MKKKEKRQVFVQWFFSYLAMLSLMILASVAIYFYSYRTINIQQEKLSFAILEKVKTEVGGYFNIAGNTAASLFLDDTLHNVIKKNGHLELSDRISLYELQKIMKNKISSTKEISHIFVWPENGDSIISDQGYLDKRLFFSLYYDDGINSFEQFDQEIIRSANGSLVHIHNSRGENEILFLLHTAERGEDTAKASILVSVSGEQLRKKLEELRWTADANIAISVGKKVICSDKMLEDELSNDHLQRINHGTLDLNQIRWQVDRLGSSDEVEYLTLIPVLHTAKVARSIQLFTLQILFLCLTLGSIIAYILARINYHPIKGLMKLFGEYKSDTDAKDEYEWLKMQAQEFFKEHKEVKGKFVEHERIIKHQYLYRLITLPYDGRNLRMQELAEDALFRGSYNLVALLSVEFSENNDSELPSDRGLLRFILTNVFEELSESQFGIAIIDLTDCFGLIINSKDNSAIAREAVEEIADQAIKFILDKVNIRPFIFFGSWHRGMEGIYTSYLRAREAMEFRDTTANVETIWYEDIKNRRTIYQYSPETEQKIVSLISIGDITSACRLVQEVLHSNYHSREMTTAMKKCLLSDMLGTIIKAAQQMGNTDFILQYMDDQDIFRLNDEHQIVDSFAVLLNTLGENICQKAMQKRDNNQFGYKVMEYVKENFKNPDLNISITALHFGITPSYLSSLFKEQTGLSLLDYINTARVEHAKLLLEKEYSLNEVCELSGFRNSNALIRVFKKNTGLTPGQMRKLFEK